MPVQVSQVTHNNNAHFYRIAIDIAKEGTEVWDLTPYFKGRVGDNNFGLQIVWYYQGQLLDVTNKKPYIKGNVGHYSFDDKKNLQMAPDADVVTSHGNPNDCQANGQVTYYFPQQMFPTDGVFKGFIGLEDENQNLTGVDIWFRVLPGVAQMGRACDFYVDILDKTIANFKEKIRQQSIDFDAALQLELQKEKDLIQQKLDAAGDAMDEDTAALKKLAAAVGAIQAQIDAGNVVTLVRHETDYNELKDNQTLLKDEIRNQLSKISFHPETFPTLAAIQAQYPKGTSNICVSMDNKHGFVWNGTAWEDIGVVLGDGLSNEEQQVLHNALHGKTIVYDEAASKPPYNDLNSLEDNTIVTYAIDITRIRHSPNNLPSGSTEGATVITVNYGNNTDGAGRIQLLITNKADQFVRIKWGNPITWSEWKSSIFRSYPIVQDAKTAQKPFDDLNTLPANSIVIYATEISSLQNIPDESLLNYSGANVITISSHLGDWDVGSLQILLLNNGQLFHRMKWGTDSKYGDWSHPLTKYDLAGIMAFSKDLKENRYNDLDKLPVNTTVTYSLNDDECGSILHYPSKVPGTVRTISCDIGEMTGQFQILVDRTNQLYHRIMWGVPGTYGAWKSEGNLIKPSISLFQNIGIIGDSYASGELYANNNYTDHYEISWGQILARKNGIKATNFSRGGLTTRSWLTDEHGLALLNNSDAQNLYIIALGINDFSLGDSYLGTENDVNTKADTFYGNYGKIIAAIQAKAPNAKIILSTMSYDGQGVQHNFNEAIKTIAKHYGLPVIVQVDDPLFTSEFYTSHMVGGHPTAPVYSAMANAFQRLIEQSMVDNLDYFMTYKQ